MERESLIVLLKGIITYYANDENYEAKLGNDASILLDKGHQAKFALEQIKAYENIDFESVKDMVDTVEQYAKELGDIDVDNVDMDDMTAKINNMDKMISKITKK